MAERETKAFALAPLPVIVPVLIAVVLNAIRGGTGDATAADIVAAMLFLLFLSYGAIAFIGVPIHLVLRHFKKTALTHYLGLTALPFVLLAGAIAIWRWLGPAPTPPVNPFGLYEQSDTAIKEVLAFAAAASLSAAIFWHFGVRQPKS